MPSPSSRRNPPRRSASGCAGRCGWGAVRRSWSPHAPLLIPDAAALVDQRLHAQLIRAEHNLAVFAPDPKESASMLFLRMAGSVVGPEEATDITSFARG